MIDGQKQYTKDWRNHIENYLKEQKLVSENSRLLFILSPNDLVYLPSNDSRVIDKSRIYKFVSCTGNEGHFIPVKVASPILQTTELGSNNKAQRAWSGEMIKETCVPLKVDRLGNIIKVGF
jgi:CRISPR-associated endonuclease Csn1